MNRAFEKFVALFCVIVFLTFMLNHGALDFSGVDWVKNKTMEAIKSDTGQEYIEETKEISKSVFHDLFYGFKDFLIGKDTEEESDLQSATYLYCLDGDTIKVKLDGEEITVRMIGIDTPESVNPDESKNNEYGEQASTYTKIMLENVTTVYLEYDVTAEDTYGRTLAYVWFDGSASEPEVNMLNAILVKNGYADDMAIPPNNKYTDLFMNLRMQAQKDKTGLWKYDGFAKLWEN